MLELKYGDSKVDIDLSEAKSVKVLNENPMDEITDLKSEFIKGVKSLFSIFTTPFGAILSVVKSLPL